MSSTFWAKTSRLPVWSSWIITLRSGNLARTRGPSDDPSPVRGSPTHTHAECTTAASLVYGSYLTLTTFKSTSPVSKVYQPTRAASPRSTQTLHHPSHTSTLRSPHTRAPPTARTHPLTHHLPHAARAGSSRRRRTAAAEPAARRAGTHSNPPPPLAHLHPPLPAYTRTPHEELLLVSRLGVPVAKILRDGTSLLLAAAFTDVDDLRPRWDTVGTRTSYRCHPGTQSSSASSAHIVVVVAPRYVWPYCSMLPRCSRHWPSVGPVDDRQW